MMSPESELIAPLLLLTKQDDVFVSSTRTMSSRPSSTDPLHVEIIAYVQMLTWTIYHFNGSDLDESFGPRFELVGRLLTLSKLSLEHFRSRLRPAWVADRSA